MLNSWIYQGIVHKSVLNIQTREYITGSGVLQWLSFIPICKIFQFWQIPGFHWYLFHLGLCHKMAVRRPYGHDFFSVYGATRSRNRVQFIHQYSSFGSSKTREEQWCGNRYGAFAEFFRIQQALQYMIIIFPKKRHFTQWSYYSRSECFL